MAGRKQTYEAVMETPVGQLGICIEENGLVAINLLSAPTALIPPRHALARQVCDQLRRYFADPTYRFDLPLAPTGTDFQQRVWRALRKIPTGRIRTYGQLARQLGSAARAVGGACRRNPVPIVIPCHRVTAQNGLGGYMGQVSGPALRIKSWLLEHERVE